MNRRDLILSTLLLYPGFGALQALAAAGAVPLSRRWARQQRDLAAGLRDGSVPVAEWRDGVTAAAETFDPQELLAAMRSEALRRRGRALPTYPFKSDVRFLDDAGTPQRLGFAAALFEFRQDDVITPHAHRNMVSAHMVVEGKFRVRTFDKLRDEGDSVLLRPAMDAVVGLGRFPASAPRTRTCIGSCRRPTGRRRWT